MRLITLVCVFTLVGCTSTQSERCKQICQRETECAADLQVKEDSFPYDLDECVVACVALERVTEGRKHVDDHLACASKAKNCEQLMECR